MFEHPNGGSWQSKTKNEGSVVVFVTDNKAAFGD